MTQAALQIDYSTSQSTGEVSAVLMRPGVRTQEMDRKVVEHLTPAIARSHGRITMENLFDALNTGKMQLFLAMQDGEQIGALVTEVVDWVSGRRSLRVILGGGFGAMWKSRETMLEMIEELADAADCKSIIVEGREGWGRVLDDEFKFSHSVFEKEL